MNLIEVWMRALSVVFLSFTTPVLRISVFFALIPHLVFGLFKPKNPEEHRYYLLPGMGRSNRRQRQLYFRAAIIVGLIVAGIVGVVIYFAQRPGPPLFR